MISAGRIPKYRIIRGPGIYQNTIVVADRMVVIEPVASAGNMDARPHRDAHTVAGGKVAGHTGVGDDRNAVTDIASHGAVFDRAATGENKRTRRDAGTIETDRAILDHAMAAEGDTITEIADGEAILHQTTVKDTNAAGLVGERGAADYRNPIGHTDAKVIIVLGGAALNQGAAIGVDADAAGITGSRAIADDTIQAAKNAPLAIVITVQVFEEAVIGVGGIKACASPIADGAIADRDIPMIAQNINAILLTAGARPGTRQTEAAQIQRDIIRHDRDAIGNGHTGKIGGQIIRAGHGDVSRKN